MADKDRERRILRMVYDASMFLEIPRSTPEKPDFMVQRAGDSRTFGVEITELYESPPLARTRRMPHYVSELLNGGKFGTKMMLRACTCNVLRSLILRDATKNLRTLFWFRRSHR
jgi:hypothetical protein